MQARCGKQRVCNSSPNRCIVAPFCGFKTIWITFWKSVTKWVTTRTTGNTETRPDPRPNTPRKKIRRSATPSLRCSIRGNKNGGASTKQFQSFEPYWLGLSQLAHSLVLFASVFLCFATQVLQRSTTEEERGRGRNTKKAPQKTNTSE